MKTEIKELEESFLEYLKNNRNYSLHTLKSYQNDLSKLLIFLNESNVNHPKEISNSLIRNFIGNHRRKGLSPRSLSRMLSSLRSFFKFLNSIGIIDHDPTLGIASPKQESLLPKALDTDMINKLLDF